MVRMTLMQAMIIAVVEGITEYLPVSSTGHIILTSWIMGINEEPFVKDYTMMVQFGAILAVLVLYWKRFVLNYKIYPVVLAAFLPAAVFGLLVKKYIDQLLGNVVVVGFALLIGGILLVLTDKWISRLQTKTTDVNAVKPQQAFKIGLFQMLAFIPGVSRSAASIWGGLHQGLNLKTATEFSFFLGAPTLAGASFIKFLKVYPNINQEHIQIIVWGNIISFLVGLLAIYYFVQLVSRYGLKYFGYYRIALGAVVLIAALSGSNISA